VLREDTEAFRRVIEDLCTAFNRPITDDLVRVYWEALKKLHIADVSRMAAGHRQNGKKFPTPRELVPDRKPSAPVVPRDDGPPMSKWAVAANKALLAVAYQDSSGRGFQPIAVWERPPAGGWGLPFPAPRMLDSSLLERVLAIRRDYVQMAEEADRDGEPMTGEEFSSMCREGFGKALSDGDRARNAASAA